MGKINFSSPIEEKTLRLREEDAEPVQPNSHLTLKKSGEKAQNALNSNSPQKTFSLLTLPPILLPDSGIRSSANCVLHGKPATS